MLIVFGIQNFNMKFIVIVTVEYLWLIIIKLPTTQFYL